MGNIQFIPDNTRLAVFDETLKGYVGFSTIAVEVLGMCTFNMWQYFPDRGSDIIVYSVDGSAKGLCLKKDDVVAIFRLSNKEQLYMLPISTDQGDLNRSFDKILVEDEPFIDPLVKLGESYIHIIERYLRSASITDIKITRVEEVEVEDGVMQGDPGPDHIFLAYVEDMEEMEEPLGGAYGLYLDRKGGLEMIWEPYPTDPNYKGIGQILERLFDFSPLNPRNTL